MVATEDARDDAYGYRDDAALAAQSATGSATTATTKAAEASTSATNAAGSATTATTKAAEASTSATNAAGSATAAGTSATNASNSAAAAAGSANNANIALAATEDARDDAYGYRDDAALAAQSAASARDATLAAFDSFDDRYLGVKTSNPSVDNDGNALAAGALYFNSTAAEMRVYTGTAWAAAYVSGAGVLLISNNLSDLASASAARTNLGLATVAASGAYADLTGKPTNVSAFTNDAGYLTSFTESDPTVPSHVKAITTTKISNWDTAFGWGNHASAGYLTSFTEADPTVPSHVKSITTTNISNWNAAFGWGNHASAGYLTGITSGQVTTALGYTPYNATNPAGYITGITSGNVTTALGYTPANKAGDAFTGDISVPITKSFNCYTVNYGMGTPDSSGLQIYAATGDTMRFGHRTGGVFTERFIMGSGGNVTANVDFRAPIFYDSNNTGYYIDASSTSVLQTIQAVDGDGFRSLKNGSASITSSIYFANAANTRAWNWQLDENDAAAFWSYGGSSWGKRLGLTHNSELFLRNSSGSDVSLAYPSTFGYSSSYKTMVLGNQSLTTVCIGVSPASNPSGSFNGGGLGLEVMFRNGVNFITPNSANNGYHFPLSLADGYVASSGSFRAPIFYDTNDTGYYVDPASTSNLNAINTATGVSGPQFLCGTTNYGDQVSGSTWYGIGRSNVTGYFAGGMVQVAAYTGLRLRGPYSVIDLDGAVGGDLINFSTTTARFTGDVRAAIFYDVSDTGYYVDPNSVTRLNKLTAGERSLVGYATLSMASLDQNTWYPVTIPINAARQTRLRIENALNSNAPSWSTHPAGFSCYVEWTSNGAGWGTIGLNRRVIDWRESFTSVQIVGGIDQLTQSSTEVIWLRGGGNYFFSADNDVTPTIRTSTYEINGQSVSPRSTTYNTPWTASTGQTGAAIFYATSTITSATDVRAPIFYDTNDTSYYVDPNSTSVLNAINAWGEVGSRRNDVQSILRSYNLSAGGPLQFYLDHNYGNVNIGNSRGVVFAGGSYWEIANSVRAPIFYDSNNTNYYVDPASTSVLNETQTFGVSNIYDVSTNHAFGIFFSNNKSQAYGVFREEGAWSHPFPDLRIAFHTGIKMGANAGYGGMKFYTDYDMSSQVMSINNSADGLGGGEVFVNNSLQAGSSLRAPIFYDSNNTGFYLDPNSTGTSLNVAGSIVAAGNVTAYSDIRIKANVETIPDALDKLDQIRGVTYTRTDLDDKEQRYAGVIAQEIEKVLPEAVRDLGNIKAVDYNATIGLLIQAVKELQIEVETVKSRLH